MIKKPMRALMICLFIIALTIPSFVSGCSSSSSDIKTLFMAISSEPTDGLDPTLGWGRYGNPLFQSTLLKRDENLNVVNDLALSYTVSADGLTWSLVIREDARFSDDEPLTAEDVAYTFNTAAASGSVIDLTGFDNAVAVSEYEVEFHLKKAQSTFLHRLISLGIVPEHAHDQDYNRNPVGSGPYQLVRWDEGQQMIIEVNPYYYGDKPEIERAVFLFMTEDAAFAAAQAGEVDIVAVPQRLAKQSISGMTLYDVTSLDNRGICFPCIADTGQKTDDGYPIGNDVTANIAIRKAISYAVNRQALVDGVLEGYGSVAYGPCSNVPWEQASAIITDNDISLAKQILTDGGWTDTNGDGIREKDGLKAEFTLVYPASDSTRQSLVLACVDMIEEIGIKVNASGKSWDEIKTMMYSNAVLFGWGSHDPTEIYNLYHSSNAGQGYYNTGYYSSTGVDNYLDLAMAANSEAEAITYWQDAQWDDDTTGFTTPGDAAWAWLVNLDHTYFVSDSVDVGPRQVEPHGHGWPFTWNITSWEWK